MDWGWIILIAVVILLLIPLFLPIIVRFKAAPGELEWGLQYGPIVLLPDFEERFARFKRRTGKTFYIISRPIVWLLRLVALLLRIVTWPLRMVLRLFRKRKASKPPKGPAAVVPEAEHFEEPPQVEEEWDRERPEEEFPAAERIRPPEAEPSEPDSNIFPEDFTEDAWTSRAPEREEPGELEPEPEQSFVHEGGPAVTPPPELEEKELSDLEPPPSATREEQEKETKKPSPGGLKNLPGIGKASDLFGKAKEGFATFQEYKGQYGPVIKKTLRALILFGFESIRQFKFKVLQLAWTTGGDPASLGQILGFHEALVASVDPRLRRHVHFVPQWENDDLSPRGSGHIELYIWPYRFVPPFFRFFFRLPWIGIFRIAREQMRKNKS